MGMGVVEVRNWREMPANEDRISFWGDENVLKMTMVMTVQLCEYTENH
jgi:hypothetical protein